MGWIIKIPGEEVQDELDWTLDDLDYIEKESGVSWLAANPAKSAKVLKAFIRLSFRKVGKDPKDVDALRQRDIRGWLDFIADEDAQKSDGDAVPLARRARPRKRPASSVTSPTSTSGPQASADSNAS